MLPSRVQSFTKNISGASRVQKSFSNSRRSTFGINNASNASRNQSFLNSTLQTSHAIEDTGSHIIETFGTPLPVLVTEALTLAERSERDVTVRLDTSGWAWLVSGRRLFVWKYKLGPGQRLSSAPQCRELTLPPSDLSHKADLVCIFPSDDRLVPSALAVSPEGTIRYWASIAHESSSVETNAELYGQECYSLTSCQAFGFVLATTTGTLILISPSGSGQENALVCRNLTIAKGVLARLSRRVSSFIFGSMPTQATESRLVRALVDNDLKSDVNLLYILSGNSLQKWEICEDEGDKLLFDCDVDAFVRDKFIEQLWSRDMLHPHQLKVWLIDMQLSKHGLFVFASSVSPREPHKIRYSLGVIDIYHNSMPTIFSAFIVLSHIDNYNDADEDEILNYRLLIPDSKSDCAYVYRNNIVLCISLEAGSEETDKVEFRQPGDIILGAGSYDGLPLFFLQNHGIVSVSSSNLDDSISVASTSGIIDVRSESFNLTCSMAQLEDLASSQDKTSQLKAALFLYCRKNITQSQAIIEDIFPPSLTAGTDVNSVLDTSVISLSQQTIDDYPATDPRWAETVTQETGFTSSLIILRQLEDKQKAHQLFITFLQQSDLWDRLQIVTYGNHSVSTRRVLWEHAEKLVAAKALRTLPPQYANLIESAIKIALKHRKVAPSGKLTNQDLFYREVSKVQDIIPSLLEIEEKMISEGVAHTIINTVTSVNNILLTILRQVSQYQQTHSSEFSSDIFHADGEYVPWTSTVDSGNLRLWLKKQHSLVLEFVVKAAQDKVMRSGLFQQLMDITDLVLDGYRCQLQSLEHTNNEPGLYETLLRQYETDRSILISSFLRAEQYERAASLAEKYLDFDILVRLCDVTNNEERLNRYVTQFADQGFSEFTFKWYLREGKHGKLLSHPVLQQESLLEFLKDYNSLSWLHDISVNRYPQAHHTLKLLGLGEKDLLVKKKTMLSLSKLCALASDLSPEEIQPEIDVLNQEQDLIIYQETLPATVLEKFSYDLDTMRVMSPTELIELYVCEENVSANEYDFKKALDLLHFVYKESVEEYERLKNLIWCRAILKDNWAKFDKEVIEDPISVCTQTVFFSTIELAFNDGADLKEILPNVNNLLENELLAPLVDNSTFRFLIQAGFEQMENVIG